ncbi:tRNA (adenosine(37)-N6)-threonylcarbamoyltransferase complex dimerization subunit type 1 TsaB [Echinicola sediminis]
MMKLILSIETAVAVCSVAIHEQGRLLGLIELHQENVHAQKLMPAINSLLEQVGVTTKKLSAVAVSEGPGSYTGLRIGVSTAKGIAYAHGIPLIGVGSLDAMAKQALPWVESSDMIVPMVDARRMEVYCKVFNGQLEELSPLRPVVVDEGSFGELFEKGKVYFLGDGAEKVSQVIHHPNARFLNYTNSAVTVGEMAYEKFLKEDFVDVAYFEPNYLKEFRVVKSKKNPLAI